MRAAALIAQPGYGADGDRHDIFAELADREFLRCCLAESVPADGTRLPLSASPARRHADEP